MALRKVQMTSAVIFGWGEGTDHVRMAPFINDIVEVPEDVATMLRQKGYAVAYVEQAADTLALGVEEPPRPAPLPPPRQADAPAPPRPAVAAEMPAIEPRTDGPRPHPVFGRRPGLGDKFRQ